MKKFFLLLFASVLVFSCTKDVELADSTADLSTTLAQYDDTNMGVYKGLFTTQGTMERGTIEINITPGNYGVATLKLVSGQEINFKADRRIEAGAEVQGLQFNSSTVMASFKLSADMDGNNVVISDVVYKGITSGAIAAHETSRAPVTPITGVLACDDCDAHPLLVTGDTGTFSLLFVGDGSTDDAVTALADVGVVVSVGGVQELCVDGGATTTCDIAGDTVIGNNGIFYNGTHTFNNNGDCSSAVGTWALDSGNHGAFFGTWTSDTASCAPPANDTCAAAEAIACGDTVIGNNELSTDDNGDGRFDNWYVLSGLTSGDLVTISMCNASTDYDTWLGVYDACAGATIASNDDSSCVLDGLFSEVQFTSDGSDVWIAAQGFSTSTGTYEMSVSCVTPPPSDFIPNCGDTAWTDDGGELGDYSTGINEVHTIDGGAGNVVTANFSAFELENEWDYMAFYDGPTTADPEILTSDLGAVGGVSPNNTHHGFTDFQLLGDGVTSTGQFLTIEFQSDTSVSRPGWVGSVDCAPPVPGSNTKMDLKYNKKPSQEEIEMKKTILRKLGIMK